MAPDLCKGATCNDVGKNKPLVAAFIHRVNAFISSKGVHVFRYREHQTNTDEKNRKSLTGAPQFATAK